MSLKINTDITHVSVKSLKLPAAFVEAEEWVEGEWVYKNNAGEAVRVTENVVTHPGVYPLFSSSDRKDVQFSGDLSAIEGDFEGETDQFKSDDVYTADAYLTVYGDGGSPERGKLRLAATGEICIAQVTLVPVTGVNGLGFRRLMGAGRMP